MAENKTKTFADLESKIATFVATRNQISIKSSTLNVKLEKYSLQIIAEILRKFGQERYVELLYTIAKELVTNGIKANQKRVFFEDHGFDIRNPEQYTIGLEKFRDKFSENMSEVYGKRCLARGVHVWININYSENGIFLEIINNTPMIKTEENRMRQKIKRALTYSDIAEFYLDNMENGEDMEGAGLGIAMVMILLKNQNIDTNLFRILAKDSYTMARVEIPFNAKYVSQREIELKQYQAKQLANAS